MVQDVKNILDVNELVRHAGERIGNGNRKKVFLAIYAGKQAMKSVPELAKKTGLTEKRVVEEGKKLHDDGLVGQTKTKGRIAYKKDARVARNRGKILSLLKNPALKKKYPTKQEPKAHGTSTVLKLNYGGGIAKPKYCYVAAEEIDSFSKIKGVKNPSTQDFSKLSEQKIKEGFQKILQQEGKFKDWGGEANDLFTGKLKYKGKQRLAAFAFKGKATKGRLKPNMMGKNGDQVGRLFTSPAEFFLIVYPRDIDQSIVTQMEAFAIGKSMTGRAVYYTAIGGSDFAKIYNAYNKFFT